MAQAFVLSLSLLKLSKQKCSFLCSVTELPQVAFAAC